MLSFILGMFGSSGFGSILGCVGGLANRFMDLKLKNLDIEKAKLDNQFELAKMEAETSQLKMEWEAKAQVASIEAAGQVDTEAYKAMAASYDNDKATYGIPWLDAIRGLVRPIVTMIFVGVSLFFAAIVFKANRANILPLESYVKIIDWLLLEAGVVIGWWFASRPSSQPGK